jgi:hypothetical protein
MPPPEPRNRSVGATGVAPGHAELQGLWGRYAAVIHVSRSCVAYGPPEAPDPVS